MLVHATFDPNGLPTGFWPEDIFPNAADGSANTAVPKGAVEIAEADWEALRAAHGTVAYAGGKVVPYTPPAVPARPRTATTYQLMSALTDDQRVAYPGPIKAWDQRLFSARDTPWPETNEKIGRIATALGTTAKAWFDAALGVAG